MDPASQPPSPSTWSPKRRRLDQPSTEPHSACPSLPNPLSRSDNNDQAGQLEESGFFHLPRPVRRNAQCIPKVEGDQHSQQALRPSLSENHTSPAPPPPADLLQEASSSLRPRSASLSPRPAAFRVKNNSRVETTGAYECSNDDLEALTQRSILQELHEIHEESSQACSLPSPEPKGAEAEVDGSSETRGEASQLDGGPQRGFSSANHPDEAAVVSVSADHDGKQPIPSASTTEQPPSASRTMERPSASTIEEPPSVSTAEEPPSTSMTQKLDLRSIEAEDSTAPEQADASASAVANAAAAPMAAILHPSSMPVVDAAAAIDAAAVDTDNAVRPDVDVDHSLLFDGLDSDAFDDIVLSPVDPIKATKPAFSSFNARGPPSSPLVARKQLAGRVRAFAPETLHPAMDEGSDEDIDGIFGSQSCDFDRHDSQDFGRAAPSVPPIAFQGFRTAANAKLSGPSDAAMKRARRLVFSQSDGPSSPRPEREAESKQEPQAVIPPMNVDRNLNGRGQGSRASDDSFGDTADLEVKKEDPMEGFGSGLGGASGVGSGGGFRGFSNAKGIAIRPSAAALAAAKRLFAEINNEGEVSFISQTPPPTIDRSKGRADQPPSKRPSSQLRQRSPPAEMGTAASGSGSALPSATSENVEDVAKAAELDRSLPPLPGLARSELGAAVVTVSEVAADGGNSGTEPEPAVATQVFEPTVQMPMAAASDAASAATVMRTPTRPLPMPLQSHRRAGPSSIGSPRFRAFALSSGAGMDTPASQKRVSLGMTPRGKQAGTGGGGGGSARSKFRTPFKEGAASMQQQHGATSSVSSPFRAPLGPSRQANIVYPQPASASQRSRGALLGKAAGGGGNALSVSQRPLLSSSSSSSAVFDLTPRHSRQSLAASSIVPEGISPLQAIARGVPDEVLVILTDASKAAFYAFDGPDGDLLGPQQALETLLARGCSYAEPKWVKNHWSLILWKMASLTRHRPDEASWRWSWDEVIRQLLYRYEREINRIQRSCVKRIQEHDSPAHLPMVLFVARILESTEHNYDDEGAAPRREVTLELSDGWYRIRADVDVPLSEATGRGRIRVGQKLAIAGAKLQSSGDGTEVLDALLTSTLKLSGNSVSLARWDAKLGFSNERFFASLRSLTPEGGVVTAMDIVITKVFPLAYIDADSDPKNGTGARGEAEEHEERDAWLQRLEETRAKLEARFDQGDRWLDALLMALEAVSSGNGEASMSDSSSSNLRQEDESFSTFCSIEEAEDPVSAFKTLVVNAGKLYLVPHLVLLVRSRLMAGGEESRFLLHAELEKLCPPRKVRDFRVIRFRDARLPPPPRPSTQDGCRSPNTAAAASRTRRGKNVHARTVQLTVWDAAALGERLREGARVEVHNLVPTQKRAWRRPDDEADVFLSTRRDTRWTPVNSRFTGV